MCQDYTWLSKKIFTFSLTADVLVHAVVKLGKSLCEAYFEFDGCLYKHIEGEGKCKDLFR